MASPDWLIIVMPAVPPPAPAVGTGGWGGSGGRVGARVAAGSGVTVGSAADRNEQASVAPRTARPTRTTAQWSRRDDVCIFSSYRKGSSELRVAPVSSLW